MRWSLLAFLLVAVPAAADGLKLDAAIVIAGHGVDLWTTQNALGRGGRELVGPSAVGGTSGRVALKLAISGATVYGCHELRKRGHKNQARVLAILAGLGGAVPAILNLRR